MRRIYANENFPAQVVNLLRQRGHDVLTVRESGNAQQQFSDEDVLSFATREQRAVLTLNRRHFIRLHAEHPDHGGIIVCTFDLDFAALAERVHVTLSEADSLQRRLIRVNRPG